MSRGRRAPEPAIPVGSMDPLVAPPEPMGNLAPPPEEREYVADEDIPEGPNPMAAVEGDEGDLIARFDSAMPDDPEPGEGLSPEEELMFASLLTCGRRSKTIKIMDHTVVVETVNGDDDLRIGLYAKPYVGSLGEQRAYQIAVAAAGIRSIDGKPFATTVYSDVDNSALFDEKVAKVQRMYPHVIQRIYRAVVDAEKEFAELVERLGKSDG
jgi:hypothetical protein